MKIIVLTSKTSLIFAAFCIKHETIFKNLAIQYLKFQDIKLVNFDLKFNEKFNLDFAIYMFEVKKYFAENNEVDNWKKIHIYKKIKEIQKIKTIVKIECISSDEYDKEYKFKHNRTNNNNNSFSSMSRIKQCYFCKIDTDANFTSIDHENKCYFCKKLNIPYFDICKNCIQKSFFENLDDLITKTCCYHRLNKFLKNLSFEIDLDSFIKPNWIYLAKNWLQTSNTNRYYENLDVFLEYNNIDEFISVFLIEDEKATLTFTCDSQKYKIKFDPRTTDKNILFLLFHHKKSRKDNIFTYDSCFICCEESEDLFLNCENIGPVCSHLVCKPCSEIVKKTNKDNLCEGCRRPLK